MDLSFPIKEHLSEDTYISLVNASRLINKNHFEGAIAALTLTKEGLNQDDLISKAIISHRINSANYQRGEYIKAYDAAEALIKDLQSAKEENKEEKELTNDIDYLLIKEQAFVAKCLNKMKDYVKAEQVCDDIVNFIKEKNGEVHSYFKFAVRALYMKSKNMLNMMEFKRAKEILED